MQASVLKNRCSDKGQCRQWPFAPLTVEGVWGRSKIGMGCGATKMYLSRFFAKKPMKASHRRSKTTVNERAFLHAVDLCSTVSRKTKSKPIWFPDMSKTRQPAYPRNIIFKKTKCACAMQEIETSNGNHSIRQRLPSRKQHNVLPGPMRKFHPTCFGKTRKPHHFHKAFAPRSQVSYLACMKNWFALAQARVGSSCHVVACFWKHCEP